MKIIDAQVHIWGANTPERPWPKRHPPHRSQPFSAEDLIVEMDAAGVERMIELMPYHLVGVAPFGALLVLARAHVALKNSRIMVSMGLINACSNVLFDVVLLRPLGLKGVALSTSLVHTVVAIVFYVRLESRLAREGLAVGVTA